MALFHLDWLIDSAGYRLMNLPDFRAFFAQPAAEYAEGAHPLFEWLRTAGLPEEWGAPLLVMGKQTVIVRNGGDLVPAPGLKIAGMCHRLAEVRTPDDALMFVSKFGFLEAKPEVCAERAGAIRTMASFARKLVGYAQERRWRKIAEHLTSDTGDDLFNKGACHIDLGDINSERPALLIRPANLYEAAIVQLLEEVSFGTAPKRCARPGCGEYFRVGPGTGRRSTAEYCSPKCQNAHAYMKRKETGHDQGIDHPPRKKVLAAKVRRRPRSGHK